MTDANWSEPEARMLAAMPREFALPAGAESRLISALSRPRPRGAWLAALGVMTLLAGAAGGAFLESRRPAPAAPEARYALLLYGDVGEDGNEALHQALVAEYSGWARRLAERRQLATAAELKTRQVAVARSPIPEPVRGYFLLSVNSAAEAERIARECPHARHGGQVIVQEVGAH